MANEEQLAILRRGSKAWNVWRREHLSKILDFSGGKLSGGGLGEVHLSRADLSRADLSGARLGGADLTGADLTGANLSWADLTGTDLSRADLTGADLSSAELLETVLVDTNLAGAKGLDTCHHFGPSTLDHRTLAKSGPLPLAFLRGVGLPDGLIEYLPSLLGEAIQFYACFISYSSQDQTFAERLHADLQNKGVRCWFAPEDLKIGERIRVGVDEAIRVHDKLLLILSEHSVASQWVEQEVESTLEQERQTGKTILFPIRLDDAVMTAPSGWPRLLRNTRNIGDMRAWKDHDAYQRAFDRLLRDLRAEGAAPGPARQAG